MKKALSFIIASFVFASVFFKSIPAKASDYAIPESGWLPVIYDIFYSLVNGNELNVSEIVGDLTGINAVIDKYNEMRAGNYKTPFASAINMSYYTYLASMYEGDLYDLAAEYSIYLKDGTYPVLGSYTKDRIARWNQYNTQFNDKYLNSFAPETEVIYPNPDINYITYLNKMNTRNNDYYDFYFYNYPFLPSALFNNQVTYFIDTDATKYSWACLNGTSFYTFPISGNKNNIVVVPSDILTININGSGNTYSTNFTFTSVIPAHASSNENYFYNTFLINSTFEFLPQRTSSGQTFSTTVNLTNTLDYILDYISNRFRNVNIYVNGYAWSLVDVNAPSELIIGPDVIRNDNGLIDSQDVFVPDQELAFDLIGLINLLEDALQNQDKITFDDIINDGTILKNPDGTALDDARAHILQNTIQRVIADEYERDDPEPIPTTTPPPYPTFPEVNWRKNPIPEPLPTGFDTSNGNPADAFSGASTLAQIVDATNRGLPSELVYTFWGIVFGMIVLGIIKVLHK